MVWLRAEKTKKICQKKLKKKSQIVLQNWKIDLKCKKKKRQKLYQKKVKKFALNGHCAVPVNTTLEFILKHNLYGYAFECVYQLFE